MTAFTNLEDIEHDWSNTDFLNEIILAFHQRFTAVRTKYDYATTIRTRLPVYYQPYPTVEQYKDLWAWSLLQKNLGEWELTGGEDIANYQFFAYLQSEIESLAITEHLEKVPITVYPGWLMHYHYFIDYTQAIDGGFNGQEIPKYDLASFRVAAGLHVDGYRRATDWPTDWTNPADTAYSHGPMEAGDIIGPWVFDDLQNALAALRWTLTVKPTTPVLIATHYGEGETTGEAISANLASNCASSTEWGYYPQIFSYIEGEEGAYTATSGVNRHDLSYEYRLLLSKDVDVYIKPSVAGAPSLTNVFNGQGFDLTEDETSLIVSNTATDVLTVSIPPVDACGYTVAWGNVDEVLGWGMLTDHNAYIINKWDFTNQ